MHHQFLGLFIDEWASLVAIGGGLGTTIALIMRAVLQPLKQSIDRLDSTINMLGNNSRETNRRVERLEDRFEEHIGDAKVRNQRITALEKEVYKK
ncbi:hypothetical protein [Limosilactobacillus reuteri]|uniref:hypothetical protein n=1 Tax=Limosilactobacillus reuteri TaxID=1598 RepID=UPI0015DED6F8|nr:hypothetical protein [Limosilactobacillus reuteri]QLL75907.1 hypothetical protein GTO86_04680 [Limosilactobacillus reuteri]